MKEAEAGENRLMALFGFGRELPLLILLVLVDERDLDFSKF